MMSIEVGAACSIFPTEDHELQLAAIAFDSMPLSALYFCADAIPVQIRRAWLVLGWYGLPHRGSLVQRITHRLGRIFHFELRLDGLAAWLESGFHLLGDR